MKTKSSWMTSFLVMFLILSNQLYSMPANPNPVTTTQPDGTEITIKLFGDEWYHFYENEDGYAIMQNDDKWWVYANLDISGRYTLTSFRVNKNDQGTDDFLNVIGMHLREDKKYWTENKDNFINYTLPGIYETAAAIAEDKALVTLNVPVVLIQYTDFFASQTLASFNNMMNQNNYNGTGSFNDYYTEISYGDLTISATVFGWYTSNNPRSNYQHGSGGLPAAQRAKGLVREAVDAAENTGSANWIPFDNDLDGNVDVVFIVHQGRGAECGITTNIWSHRWFLNSAGTNLSVNYDGKLIDSYIIQPELSCGAGHIEIGVFCHEFGHALGLPDLYDIDGSSEGIGNWGVMGGGGWGGNGTSPQTPTHMCAWSKIEQTWITPQVVPANITGQSILNVENNREVYKLWTNGSPGTQYFLVENRQQTGFDSNLPTGGLAIWHIDSVQRESDNSDNTNENHKLVDLEEADGNNDLDTKVNRGDAGDLYPGSSLNQNFNGTTNPNSDDYANAATDVCVDNISSSASTMTADFCVTPTGGTPDLLIRDCAADVGAEPNNACAGNFVRSLDLWIDNNDDGIIDAPIKGQVNHFYIRSWNIGGPTTNAKVKCWYVNPSLGLRFPGSGTQIVDAVTFQSELTISTVGTLAPTPGGTGYRVFFNWNIPNPPPNIDHYCIGCVIENPSDPQVSDIPLQENNLGQINYWALALKAGTTPAKSDGHAGDTTIFREEIQVNNPFETPELFMVLVEGLPPEYDILPGFEIELFLPPFETIPIVFDIIKPDGQHKDSAHVVYNLFKMPEFDLVGALHHDLFIDDLPPEVVPGFEVNFNDLPGDNYPRPTYVYELTWFEPFIDTGGFDEDVRYFEIYASPDSTELNIPNKNVLVTQTMADADLNKPGFQFHYTPPDSEIYYFTIVPVDLADNAGDPVPAQTAGGCCIGIRGNIDGLGEEGSEINIADLVYFVAYSFDQPPGPEPPCPEEANVDGSGEINIADIVYMVAYMFEQPPGPAPVACP